MQNLVITRKGQELMTSHIAEGITVRFTKIALSEHVYQRSEIESLLSIEDIKQEVPISKLSRKDETMIQIVAGVTNDTLTEGYYINTLGLYVKDSEDNEMLYAVAIDDTPDYLSAFDNKTISSISYKLNVKVSNSEQVTIVVSPDTYATVEQVTELEEKLTNLDVYVKGEGLEFNVVDGILTVTYEDGEEGEK